MRNQYENLLLLLVLSTPAFPQQFAIHYGPTHMERFWKPKDLQENRWAHLADCFIGGK